MFNNENITVRDGHLFVGDCDCVALAKEYGTPLYVMDETTLRKNCRLFVQSMQKNYKKSLVLYASKALNCKELCRIADSEGMGLDVVSGGELYTALKAGVSPKKLFFHGNNKTADELNMAIDNKIGRIIVDNIFELEQVDRIAESKGACPDIMFRIKPGVDAHTHDFIRTGQIDSKFGFALENGEAYDAVKTALSLKNVHLTGLHCHIGSQIFNDDPFIEAAKIMLGFYKQIKEDFGVEFDDLNLGGGFGIKYIEQDNPMAYDSFMSRVADVIHDYCSVNGLTVPRVLIEPGRSIVGSAGVTLYTVGAVKEIKGVRNYVTIDGGMCDNPRYALYQSDYTAIVANRADCASDYTAAIGGKCCESGDLIGQSMKIAKPDSGDILAVLSTGAYNYSMASNYNRNPRPAMVMVDGDKSRVIIKRETYEDIIRNDI
ncbi:MAG: diaminopimelate decarboxylase [Acutalibacteraceae bacterium]